MGMWQEIPSPSLRPRPPRQRELRSPSGAALHAAPPLRSYEEFPYTSGSVPAARCRSVSLAMSRAGRARPRRRACGLPSELPRAPADAGGQARGSGGGLCAAAARRPPSPGLQLPCAPAEEVRKGASGAAAGRAGSRSPGRVGCAQRCRRAAGGTQSPMAPRGGR